MDVARHVLARARARLGRALWVATAAGSTGCRAPSSRRGLPFLVEGARQARLYLAKERFEL